MFHCRCAFWCCKCACDIISICYSILHVTGIRRWPSTMFGANIYTTFERYCPDIVKTLWQQLHNVITLTSWSKYHIGTTFQQHWLNVQSTLLEHLKVSTNECCYSVGTSWVDRYQFGRCYCNRPANCFIPLWYWLLLQTYYVSVCRTFQISLVSVLARILFFE